MSVDISIISLPVTDFYGNCFLFYYMLHLALLLVKDYFRRLLEVGLKFEQTTLISQEFVVKQF